MQIRTCISVLALTSGILLAPVCGATEAAPQVELKTNLGTIVVELDSEAAPKTVKNFLQYVKSGFYSGTIFHRVIDNFMIQGGGVTKDLKDKKTNPPIPLEAQLAFDHGLKNDLGTIAMAREEQPNTATAQFYINVANNDFLNPIKLPDGDPVQIMRHGSMQTIPRAQALMLAPGYTPFGRVIEGMDVVNQIKVLETSAHGENRNVPNKTVTIISARILKTPIKAKTIEEQLGNKSSMQPATEVQAPVAPVPPTSPESAPAPATNN
ncbi:peptidyl-prolyl cis-trans isomerase A (cyclophilin A) [Oxalobacteraceae bacterium GrIS 2.11]